MTRASPMGLNKASKGSGKFSRSLSDKFKRIGKAAAVASAAVAAGTGAILASTAKSADRLAKMSRAVGVSVESLSALSFAAEQSGIDMEFLGKRLVNLSRRARKATEGPNAYRRAFDELGVTLTDENGNLKNTEALLLEVADRFSKLEDGTKKTALATEIFSNQGAKLLPFLSQGKEGIEALKEEAGDLGRVIDTKTALAAERFNDRMNKLKSLGQGVANVLLKETVPTLVRLTDRLVNFVKTSDTLPLIGEAFAFVFKTIVSAGQLAVGVIKEIATGLGTLSQAIKLVFEGDFSAAADLLKNQFQEMKRISQDTVNAMVQTWTTSGETISQQTKQVGKGITEGVTKPTKEAKTAVDRLLERINKIEQAQGKIKRITDFLRPDQVEIQPIPIPGAESISRVDAFAESSGRTRWPGFTLPGETTSEPWPGW